MASNYFAPTFRVTIEGSKLQADVSKNIMQLSVVHELNTQSPDRFSLTLANPYPEMRWTHKPDDASLFQWGNAIQIEMGYVNNLQLLFDGEITQISPSFPESGTPTLTIQGETRVHRLQKHRKERPFNNRTDQQIVEEIAQDAKLTAKADATKPQYPSIQQKNQTDWQFLQELAKRNNFEVLVEGKTLIFRKPRNKESKVCTLTYGETLRSFDPTLNSQNQVSSVIVRGYDAVNKKKVEGKAGAGDEEAKVGGQKTGATLAQEAFGESAVEVIVDQPVSSQEEADRRAKSIYNARLLEVLQGRGAAIGMPELRAGRVIELQGLGQLFNGQYYVTQSTHTISNSGYTTSFVVKRNSVP